MSSWDNTETKTWQELEAENIQLKAELEKRDRESKSWNKFQFWVGKKVLGFFLGWRLNDSIRKLFTELKHGKVNNETLADAATHALWRFTRVGFFKIIIPLTFLIFQIWLLYIQNQKIEAQNQKIEVQSQRMIQQTYLQEAERRSSQVFLFSNVQDKIDEELKNPSNKNNTLSDQTIGRIIALSLALKPYRYLENDTLIGAPISPERAQLLISLTSIKLDTASLSKIFKQGDYSKAELNKAQLSHTFLQNINLGGAVLNDADLSYANLYKADLSKADLKRINLKGANLNSVNLSGSIFNDILQIPESYVSNPKTNVRTRHLVDPPIQYIDNKKLGSIRANRAHVAVQTPDLSYARLKNALLTYAYLRNVVLKKADLSNANLSGTILTGADLSNSTLSSSKFNDALLYNANLNNANLFKAELKNANLQGASLKNSDLRYSDLTNADLRGANLVKSNFSHTDLRGADLRYCDLKNANLANTDLRNADLSEAKLENVDLAGANLDGAIIEAIKLKGKAAKYINGNYRILKITSPMKNHNILKKK